MNVSHEPPPSHTCSGGRQKQGRDPMFPHNLAQDSCDDADDVNVQRFREGLVFKAHELVYRSTLGLRVIKKKRI